MKSEVDPEAYEDPEAVRKSKTIGHGGEDNVVAAYFKAAVSYTCAIQIRIGDAIAKWWPQRSQSAAGRVATAF